MMRRPILRALLLLAACAQRSSPPPALVGAWRSELQFSTGAFAGIKDLEFMYVFNQGGTLTESSNYDAAPPVPPAYGTWRATGPNQFEATYEFYVTAPAPAEDFKAGAGWLPSGRGVFTEKITLAADGMSFTSTITYQALDKAGKPIAGGGEATAHGLRLTAYVSRLTARRFSPCPSLSVTRSCPPWSERRRVAAVTSPM